MESSELAEMIRAGQQTVGDVAGRLLHDDGVTSPESPAVIADLVDWLPSLSVEERASCLRLVWELTVDPRCVGFTGTKGTLRAARSGGVP
jgi:hypothetical protein